MTDCYGMEEQACGPVFLCKKTDHNKKQPVAENISQQKITVHHKNHTIRHRFTTCRFLNGNITIAKEIQEVGIT